VTIIAKTYAIVIELFVDYYEITMVQKIDIEEFLHLKVKHSNYSI